LLFESCSERHGESSDGSSDGSNLGESTGDHLGCCEHGDNCCSLCTDTLLSGCHSILDDLFTSIGVDSGVGVGCSAVKSGLIGGKSDAVEYHVCCIRGEGCSSTMGDSGASLFSTVKGTDICQCIKSGGGVSKSKKGSGLVSTVGGGIVGGILICDLTERADELVGLLGGAKNG